MPMDWSNERWIKLYTRRTAEDFALSWQARLLWKELLAECGRKGRINVKPGLRRYNLLAGLLHVPVEFVKPAIEDMLADGRVQETDFGFFVPNYEEAQRARASAAQRKRKQRELEGQESQNVTEGSHGVTDCPRLEQKRGDQLLEEEVREPRSRSLKAVRRQETKTSSQPNSKPPPLKVPPQLEPMKRGEVRPGEFEIRPGVKRMPDGSIEFNAEVWSAAWEMLQVIRKERGLGGEMRARDFQEWHHEYVCALDNPTDQLCRAYVMFLEDEDFAERGWPTKVFMVPSVCMPRLSARRKKQRSVGFR